MIFTITPEIVASIAAGDLLAVGQAVAAYYASETERDRQDKARSEAITPSVRAFLDRCVALGCPEPEGVRNGYDGRVEAYWESPHVTLTAEFHGDYINVFGSGYGDFDDYGNLTMNDEQRLTKIVKSAL